MTSLVVMRYRELNGHWPLIGAKKDSVAAGSVEVSSGTKPEATETVTPA